MVPGSKSERLTVVSRTVARRRTPDRSPSRDPERTPGYRIGYRCNLAAVGGGLTGSPPSSLGQVGMSADARARARSRAA